MKSFFLFLFSLFLFATLQAQSDDELNGLMDELDDDTMLVVGDPIYNRVDVAAKPLTSMTVFYGKVNDYIKENIHESKTKFGRIYIDFVVEIDGKLTDVKIGRGLEPALNLVAIEAIKNAGDWVPGKNGIITVRTQVSQPIMISEDLLK